MLVKVIKVYLETKQRKISNVFTYLISSEDFANVEVGTTVEVPFNNQLLSAFVIEKLEVNPKNYSYTLKEINKIHEIQQLSPVKIKLIKWLREKYLVSFNDALDVVYPPKVRTLKKTNQEIHQQNEREISVYVRTKQPIVELKLQKLNQVFKSQKYCKKVDLLNYDESLNNYQIDKALKAKYLQKIKIKQSQYIKPSVNNNEKFLTAEQVEVINEIQACDEKNVLLMGEMGSGKTEIYIKIIESLAKDEQILIIEPNGLLKQQIVQRLKAVYPNQVLDFDISASGTKVYNDNLGIKQGQYQIIISSHHGLFASWKDLKYVIVDEAHDFNYQNRYPEYNLFELLRYYQTQVDFKLLIATATPKIDQYARSLKGYYHFVQLPAAYVKTNTTIELEKLDDYELPISAESLVAIKTALTNKQKVMVLHNKLGYASALECRNCYRVPTCPNCNSPLNYYQENVEKLRCHRCNFQVQFTNRCSRCKIDNSYQPIGIGIEQVKKHLQKYFSDVPIHQVDSTTSKTERKQIMSEFAEQKPQILLGTQIITLGIDFSDIGLGVVTNVDYSLINQHVESREITMQLLTQFKGRIGRRGEKAKLIIQTKYPEDNLFKEMKDKTYYQFMKNELNNRYLLQTYPYTNSAKLDLFDLHLQQLDKKVSQVINNLPNNLNVNCEVIAKSYKRRYKDEFYYQKSIIIRYKHQQINEIVGNILEKMELQNDIYSFNPIYKI